MFAKVVKTSAMLVLSLSLGFTALAQQQQPAKPAASESQWVDFTGFKGKIFDIKNREPRDLIPTLRPLGSGFKGAVIEANPDFKTIAVRDFPENIAAIEEAIKRLDVPPPPPPPRPTRPATPTLEIYAYILIASNVEGPSTPVPPAIKDVLPQLNNTLNYKNYQLLSSIVQRTSINNGRIESSGGVTPPDKVFSARYKLNIEKINADNGPPDYFPINLPEVALSLRGDSNDDYRFIGEGTIQTRLSLREGEKVVVGTANLKDRAMILILSAKAIK
jgi:hypothetical protein